MNAETQIKLLRLALDIRTPEHEANTAFNRLRHAIVDWEAFKKALLDYTFLEYESNRVHKITMTEERAAVERLEAQQRFTDPTFHFGKYKGTRISEVAQANIGYIYWVVETCDRIRPTFLEQCRLAIRIYDNVEVEV